MTILFALAFGIACGYFAIIAILRTFGHKPAKVEAPAPGIAIITTASSR